MRFEQVSPAVVGQARAHGRRDDGARHGHDENALRYRSCSAGKTAKKPGCASMDDGPYMAPTGEDAMRADLVGRPGTVTAWGRSDTRASPRNTPFAVTQVHKVHPRLCNSRIRN